jgi:hypothetical protein
MRKGQVGGSAHSIIQARWWFQVEGTVGSGIRLVGVMDLHYPPPGRRFWKRKRALPLKTKSRSRPRSENLSSCTGKSRVRFQVISEEGKVLVVLVSPPAKEKEDPSLKPFLNLLTKDVKENPQRIRPFPVDLLNRARSVVENVEVDLTGPLTGED